MTIRPRLIPTALALLLAPSLLAPSAVRAAAPADVTVYVDADVRTSCSPAP